MSIRKGSTIIAGAGGNGGNSEYLINQNISSDINKIYDWVGTIDEYLQQDILHSHPEWVCFITDDSGSSIIEKKHLFTNRNAGDIFFTSRLDTVINGAVECNGGIYNCDDYTGAQSVPSLLRREKLHYVPMATYEDLLVQNGSVGYFGWDGINSITFRVPTLNNLFIEVTQANNIGAYIAPGLPNITGSTAAISATNEYTNGSLSNSTLVAGNYGAQFQTDYPSKNRYITLDASLSSPLYGASNTVQPAAIAYRAMVQLTVGFTDEAVETCNDLREHAVRDTDLATLLATIYPVGSVYIGTQNTCPMSTVISGSTWELVNSGKALWTGTGSNANTTITAGLPNITGEAYHGIQPFNNWDSGALTITTPYTGKRGGYFDASTDSQSSLLSFDASKSNSIYGASNTVQPPAYVVNVWRRTA